MMSAEQGRAWVAAWRDRHSAGWSPPEGFHAHLAVVRDIAQLAVVRDIRDSLPTARTLTANDLAEQVDTELERQRGWCRNADGFWGPHGS
jgi:hypothetical protein